MTRILSATAALGVAALLASCANMTDIAPSSPVASVLEQFGLPNSTCALPDGGQRMVWTQQPMGQFAWGTNVGPDGRIDRIVPLLTDAHFERLREGHWPAQRVLCEFGRPAFVDAVGIPSVRQVVWNYRYRQSSAWNSLMFVYMGADGQAVTRFHPGPDPMYEDRDHDSFF